jgi:hypothetical protein
MTVPSHSPPATTTARAHASRWMRCMAICQRIWPLPAHQDQTMSTNTKNQTNRILRYLRTGRGLTAISALTRFGCMRLAARIEEMRQEGIKVRSRTLRRNGKRFACYSLA